MLRSTIFRSMTPKTISLEAQKGMRVQKIHLGPQNPKKLTFWAPKNEKNVVFSKNLNSGIWLNIGGGSHSGPSDPDSVGPLGLIR